MPTHADVCTLARSWIDTPFAHQGRLKGVGCDCVGLLVGIATELGLPVADHAGYGRRPHAGLLQAALDAQLDRVPDLAPGRIVLMRFDADPQHVGVIATAPTGGPSLIHAYAQARRVVEHHLDAVWQSRIVAIYEFRA